jgi:hypothetical protein
VAETAFNKKTLFTSKLDLNLEKNLKKCYIWSTALYNAKLGHFRKEINNNWEVLKCGAWERRRRSLGPIV